VLPIRALAIPTPPLFAFPPPLYDSASITVALVFLPAFLERVAGAAVPLFLLLHPVRRTYVHFAYYLSSFADPDQVSISPALGRVFGFSGAPEIRYFSFLFDVYRSDPLDTSDTRPLAFDQICGARLGTCCRQASLLSLFFGVPLVRGLIWFNCGTVCLLFVPPFRQTWRCPFFRSLGVSPIHVGLQRSFGCLSRFFFLVFFAFDGGGRRRLAPFFLRSLLPPPVKASCGFPETCLFLSQGPLKSRAPS